MTDHPDLASLTIKDLRQLAGEHHIQNRSKLGKEDLVLALQGVLAGLGGRLAAAAAASAGGETTVESAAPVLASAAEIPAEPVAAAPSPAAAAEPAVEPEVITLGGDLAPAAEPEVLDAAAVADLANPAPAAGPRPLGPDGQPLGDGERRGRRRRRRRGRGRGRRDGDGFAPNGAPGAPGEQGQDQDDDGEDGDDEGQGDDAGAAAAPAPAPAPAPAAAPAAAGQPVAQAADEPRAAAPRPPAPGRGDGRDGQREPRGDRPPRDDREPRGDREPREPRDQREPRGDRDQRGDRGDREPRQGDREPRGQGQGQGPDNRPPRPRLDGQVRAVPSVLDRLCVFTRGILELCDPSTPSWAQARLSELLAEAGLVGMPATGVPHPDYHQVVGTALAKDLPAGHIAVIEAPGFALRGDRGDLFPLRKAQVRIAGSERRDQAPAERPAFQPVAERPAAVPASAPAPAAVPAAEPVEIGLADLAAVPALVAATPSADAAGLRQDPEAPRQDEQRGGRPPRDERGRGPRDRNDGRRDGRGGERRDGREPRDGRESRDGQRQRGDGAERAPERAPDGEAPAQPAERSEAPAPHPEQGRPPHYPHAPEPAGDAPTLPLAPQVPEELAARPKAEGFRSLGLNEQILADLAGIGYQQPSPIQAEAIPQVLAGRDVLGQAQTGTGKTAAFALPMLQRLYELEPRDGKPAMLVLCPTRELARQVAGEFTRMAGASGARAAVIYGGVSMDDQVRALDRHPHVVIGTPGRIIDHMRRHTLDLSRLAMAVLDEADQMLDIGFWPDVNYIIGHTPPERQMLLFSATFPDEVKQMAEKHMKNPVHVRIAPKQVTVEQVDQKFIAVPRERKNELLAHFIETQNPPQLVVFCRTKHQTDRVAEVLKRKNMSAGAIHGDLPQTKREKMLQQFRAGELQCLVATNVAARGLDIPTVSHVVNYDIPEMPEEYVHRIGRTARNGARGVARTFITPDDGQFLLEIEKHIGMELEEEKVDGFTLAPEVEVKRTIADMPVGTPRMLKPLVGGIRLGRRRR